PIPGVVPNPGPSQSRKRSARQGNSKRTKKARSDTVSTNAGTGPSIRPIPCLTSEQIDAESSVLPPSYTPDTGDQNTAESSSSRDPNVVHELWLHIIGTIFEKKPDDNAFRKLQERACS
ncbi:hypothetical protein FRC11_009914, partial [Ceratobasidium sp. 423]